MELVKTEVKPVKKTPKELATIKRKEQEKRNRLIKRLAKKTNSAGIKCEQKIQTAKRNYFEVVRSCVRELDNQETDIRKYLREIDKTHKSTVSVMINVAKSELLTKLKGDLPESYQSLYELLKLSREIGEDAFLRMVQEGQINRDMSKADATSIRKAKKRVSVSDSPETPKVSEDHEGVAIKTPNNLVEEAMSLTHQDRLSLVKRLFESLDSKTQGQLLKDIKVFSSEIKEAA